MTQPNDTTPAALLETLKAKLLEIENHCPCGARPESPKTHPHVGGCPVFDALFATDSLIRLKLAALAAPTPVTGDTTPVTDDLGLSIDMLDVDRLREWARLLLVHGADISHWGSVTFVVSKMQVLATNIETAVKEIRQLRALAAPPTPAPDKPLPIIEDMCGCIDDPTGGMDLPRRARALAEQLAERETDKWPEWYIARVTLWIAEFGESCYAEGRAALAAAPVPPATLPKLQRATSQLRHMYSNLKDVPGTQGPPPGIQEWADEIADGLLAPQIEALEELANALCTVPPATEGEYLPSWLTPGSAVALSQQRIEPPPAPQGETPLVGLEESLGADYNEALRRIASGAPCRWCGYNGEGFYQPHTHKPDCPWYGQARTPANLRAAFAAALSAPVPALREQAVRRIINKTISACLHAEFGPGRVINDWEIDVDALVQSLTSEGTKPEPPESLGSHMLGKD